MAKQFFKDLPDTTTPLTATRLNGLLDGEEALGNLVVDSIKSKNMVNVPTQTITSGTTLCKIDTSNITGNITLSCNYNNTGSITGVLNLRETESGTNLQQGTITANTSSTLTMTINVTNYNTIYVLAQGYSAGYSYTLSNFQVELGETATNYAPYQELNPDNFKNEEIVVGSIRSKNMFSGFLLGSYNTTTGIFDPSNTSVYATPKIPVKKGHQYCISGFDPYVYVRFFYWNGNSFVSTELTTTTAEPLVITSQGNYMAFQTSTNSTFSNLQVEFGSQVTNYMAYQELNDMEVYSAVETVIGNWIDGKPLYRKVITFSLASGSVQNVAHNINNVEFIFVKDFFCWKSGSNIGRPLNYTYNTDTNYVQVTTTNFSYLITNKQDPSSATGYAILEYTKTTD